LFTLSNLARREGKVKVVLYSLFCYFGVFYMSINIETNKGNEYEDNERVKGAHDGSYLLPVLTELITSVG